MTKQLEMLKVESDFKSALLLPMYRCKGFYGQGKLTAMGCQDEIGSTIFMNENLMPIAATLPIRL